MAIITTGRLKRLYDYITGSNHKFKKMTTEQKRVQIAKDVIMQLDMKRMMAASMYFMDTNVETRARLVNGNTEVRELFQEMPQCMVCGIGSVFVATVDRLDNLQIIDTMGLGNRFGMVRYLVKMRLFTNFQLDLIENAFERANDFCPYDEHPNRRLRRIMKRIIETKGEIDSSTFVRK